MHDEIVSVEFERQEGALVAATAARTFDLVFNLKCVCVCGGEGTRAEARRARLVVANVKFTLGPVI